MKCVCGDDDGCNVLWCVVGLGVCDCVMVIVYRKFLCGEMLF